MKLSQCKIGEIVQTEDGRIGHIVGLTHSSQYPGAINNGGSVIPLIKWSHAELPCGIHHNNIKQYKD